jgi:putative ABC transport system substrate-binding protein
MIQRREFVRLLGGTAAWPLMARAQQAAKSVIGFLHSASPDPHSAYWSAAAAFRRCLGESGFVEGQNLAIEFRWAEDRFERLPILASDLVKSNVSLIFAGGGDVAALAAKSATTKIPIVFAIGDDPVKQGIVSLSRPEGNITGVTFLVVELRAKTLELLRELVPNAATIAVLVNPNRPNFQSLLGEVLEPARRLGLQVHVLKAGNEGEIDTAFSTFRNSRVDALLVLSDPVFFNRRDQLARLEIQYKIPAVHATRGFVAAGGLISYGASVDDAYCQAANYCGRILKGEAPNNLPVMQPTKFDLVINLKTAKVIGFEVPPTLLARADEVIE